MHFNYTGFTNSKADHTVQDCKDVLDLLVNPEVM